MLPTLGGCAAAPEVRALLWRNRAVPNLLRLCTFCVSVLARAFFRLGFSPKCLAVTGNRALLCAMPFSFSFGAVTSAGMNSSAPFFDRAVLPSFPPASRIPRGILSQQ